ncbi:ATP-binding cassette domain-containing protein [Proteinivorax tanatarense]|uniref:ABC transporter ATP-binding protein n=1 Tax=Proteinivorax tanatarense TaxID=1260629 RepID=A0AAU7VJS2_9FIRM
MDYIEVNNLNFNYNDDIKALNKVSFSIKKGEKVVILGANGSGKSTLIQHLNGLLKPQQGSILIDGEKICSKNVARVRQKLGIVFDNPEDQIVASTVGEDVAFGPRNMGLNNGEVEERVNKSLSAVGISGLKDEYPFNLSFGQKKKVVIAGVLAMNPQIIVFDEPFAGLDPVSNQNMLNILKVLNDKGHTLIIATHDVDIAYTWGEKFLIFQEGMLLKVGGDDVFYDKRLLEHAGLTSPTLIRVFEGTDICVKSVSVANKILRERLR